jgi:putative IMPACT (imprinted ancient) family translation regulator
VNNSTNIKFTSAKNRFLAYRVNSEEGEMEEGYDDSGEEGAGEKLLHLLQKMEIENIMIIVCIWTSAVQIGEH